MSGYMFRGWSGAESRTRQLKGKIDVPRDIWQPHPAQMRKGWNVAQFQSLEAKSAARRKQKDGLNHVQHTKWGESALRLLEAIHEEKCLSRRPSSNSPAKRASRSTFSGKVLADPRRPGHIRVLQPDGAKDLSTAKEVFFERTLLGPGMREDRKTKRPGYLA